MEGGWLPRALPRSHLVVGPLRILRSLPRRLGLCTRRWLFLWRPGKRKPRRCFYEIFNAFYVLWVSSTWSHFISLLTDMVLWGALRGLISSEEVLGPWGMNKLNWTSFASLRCAFRKWFDLFHLRFIRLWCLGFWGVEWEKASECYLWFCTQSRKQQVLLVLDPFCSNRRNMKTQRIIFCWTILEPQIHFLFSTLDLSVCSLNPWNPFVFQQKRRLAPSIWCSGRGEIIFASLGEFAGVTAAMLLSWRINNISLQPWFYLVGRKNWCGQSGTSSRT